jgi:hypothetical protein
MPPAISLTDLLAVPGLKVENWRTKMRDHYS